MINQSLEIYLRKTQVNGTPETLSLFLKCSMHRNIANCSSYIKNTEKILGLNVVYNPYHATLNSKQRTRIT